MKAAWCLLHDTHNARRISDLFIATIDTLFEPRLVHMKSRASHARTDSLLRRTIQLEAGSLIS